MEKQKMKLQEGLFPQTSIILVRCPGCLHRFSVNHTEIQESQPKFKCSECEQMFWFPYPQCVGEKEFVAFPMDWLESPKPKKLEPAPKIENDASETPDVEISFHCPKCEEPYVAGQKECHHCGVIFEKLEWKEEPTVFPASSEVKDLWEKVIEAYENPNVHRDFLESCQKNDQLEYAATKYGTILEANPSDEMALKFKKQILVLKTAQLESREEKPRSPRKSKLKSFHYLILFIGFLMIGLGLLIPTLRNLAGFGAAFLFLSLSLLFLS